MINRIKNFVSNNKARILLVSLVVILVALLSIAYEMLDLGGTRRLEPSSEVSQVDDVDNAQDDDDNSQDEEDGLVDDATEESIILEVMFDSGTTVDEALSALTGFGPWAELYSARGQVEKVSYEYGGWIEDQERVALVDIYEMRVTDGENSYAIIQGIASYGGNCDETLEIPSVNFPNLTSCVLVEQDLQTVALSGLTEGANFDLTFSDEYTVEYIASVVDSVKKTGAAPNYSLIDSIQVTAPVEVTFSPPAQWGWVSVSPETGNCIKEGAFVISFESKYELSFDGCEAGSGGHPLTEEILVTTIDGTKSTISVYEYSQTGNNFIISSIGEGDVEIAILGELHAPINSVISDVETLIQTMEFL